MHEYAVHPRRVGAWRSVWIGAALAGAILGSAYAQELRTWSDQSGKYQVQAKFLSAVDGKVTLQRPDGSQLRIDLDKLSAEDQKHIAGLASESENPFQMVQPPEESAKSSGSAKSGESKTPDAASPVGGAKLLSNEARVVQPNWSAAQTVVMNTAGDQWSFKVEVAPPPSTARPRSLILPPKLDFFEGVRGLVVNPTCKRAIIGYTWERSPKGAQTRLILCDLEKGRVLGTGITTGLLTPVALHNNGVQVLMRREEFGFGNQDRLELWTLGRSGIVKGLQWTPYDDVRGGERDVKWAAFHGDSRLITVSGSGKLTIWDLEKVEPLYYLQISGGCLPAICPDGKHLAFAGDKQLGVLDLDSAEVVAMKPAPHMAFPVFAFSPQGKRLACAAFDRIYIWDFATGTLDREVPVTSMHIGGDLVWTSEEHLLVGKTVLLDVQQQVKVWQYEGHEMVQTCGGLTWFLAGQWPNSPGALVPAVVPQPVVRSTLQKAMLAPDFFVLKPGVTVRVNVDALPDPVEREKARAALTQKLEANGLRVGPQGTIDLIASTEVGKQREVSYHTFGRPGEQHYTIQEHSSRVKFIYQGKVAWEAQSVNIPGMLHLKEGETVQQVLKQHERPNYAYFQGVELPRLLTKPTGSPTLGSSKVTVAGLQ